MTSSRPHNELVLELRLEPSLATSDLSSHCCPTAVRELGLCPLVPLPQAFRDSD